MGIVHATRLVVGGRGRGYMPDEPDDRDLLFAAPPVAVAPLPASSSLLPNAKQRRDQGATSMCVAFGFSHAVGIRESVLGLELPPVSVMSMYAVSRSYHSVKLRDTGTYPRTMAKGLAKLGVPLEADWPFDPAALGRHPPPQCFLRGFARRGGVYQRIATRGQARLDAVRDAIRSGLPVAIGTLVDTSFGNMRGPRLVERPSDRAPLAGGHLMVIVGYSGDGARFEILNSYGPGWRDNGTCEFTADYVAWDMTTDLMIVDGWEALRAS